MAVLNPIAPADITLNVLVIAAGFQLAFPACEATTLTAPTPAKVRLVSPVITPGPLLAVKLIGRPDGAVARRLTLFVTTWFPGFGNVIVWFAFTAVTVPVADRTSYS